MSEPMLLTGSSENGGLTVRRKSFGELIGSSDTSPAIRKTAASAGDLGPAGEVVIEDGAEGRAVSALEVRIEAARAGTGTPSAANHRRFTGWRAAKIVRCGTDLIGKDDREDGEDTVLLFDRGADAEVRGGLAAKAGQTYRLTFFGPAIPRSIAVDGTEDGSGNLVWQSDEEPEDGFTEFVYEPQSDRHVRFVLSDFLGIASREEGTSLARMRLDTGEPEFDSVTVPFPAAARPVWGGTLDLCRGILTVTHGLISSYAGETLPGRWESDRDEWADGTSPSSGAQVVYELAEPVEYAVTPIEMKTAGGKERFFADCGGIRMSYTADTKAAAEEAVRDSVVVLHVWEDTRPFAALKSIAYDSANAKMTVITRSCGPATGRIINTGLLAAPAASFDPDTMILDHTTAGQHTSDAENKWFIKNSAPAVGTNGPANFTWNKGSIGVGDVWYIRPFIHYTDVDGIARMVYGELFAYTGGDTYANPDPDLMNWAEYLTDVSDAELSDGEIYAAMRAGAMVFLSVWDRKHDLRETCFTYPLTESYAGKATFEQVRMDPASGEFGTRGYVVEGKHVTRKNEVFGAAPAVES